MHSARRSLKKRLGNRFRGAILGAAIGDALAYPNQDYSRTFLSSIAGSLTNEYALPASGLRPRGQYGASTQIMAAVVSSLVDSREFEWHSFVRHLVPLWRDNLLVSRDPSNTEAMDRIVRGETNEGSCGLEAGRAEATPITRTVPIGLWSHQDPELLVRGCELCTRITHRDPRVAATAAAAAAAIASNVQTEEFHLGDFLDRTSAAAGRFDPVVQEAILDFPRILSQTEVRAVRYVESLCPDSRYSRSQDGLIDYCVPTLLLAFYYFLRSPYEYDRAVESCIRLGGQMSTAAFTAGAISGAFVGRERLPVQLVEGLLDAKGIEDCARQLHEAWLEQADGKAREEKSPDDSLPEEPSDDAR